MAKPHHVVIVGGGFGGLHTAQSLERAPVDVTLIDCRNFHLFQPLLYQVATGWLSPANIASPLRKILARQKNARVLLAEALGIDPQNRILLLSDGSIAYDTLVIAAGGRHHYFGNDRWEGLAPGLKTVEDATEMRRRILLAFEAAERETDHDKRTAWLTFVIVGGGPTGVELAGALGEIAHDAITHDFRSINPADARILLVETDDRILPPYPPRLSAKAESSLNRLGVTVLKKTIVEQIEPQSVMVRSGKHSQTIAARTVLWAAGVRASALGQKVADATGAQSDRSGRVIVEPNLSLPNYPEILVIGDLAYFAHQTGRPLPGIAPVAIQQGRYAATLITNRILGRQTPPFHYKDRGGMAIVGRAAAVAYLGRFQFSGFPAWLVWLFVHLIQLVEYENRILVLIQWGWNYFTRNRGARLITGEKPLPLIH